MMELDVAALDDRYAAVCWAEDGLGQGDITMGKRTKRWPIWKIATATVACGLACPMLFLLSLYMEKTVDEPSRDPLGRTPVMTVSSVVTVLSMAALILAVLGLVWLIVRIRDARTPAWKKELKRRRF
jgi:hypothetical protein